MKRTNLDEPKSGGGGSDAPQGGGLDVNRLGTNPPL